MATLWFVIVALMLTAYVVLDGYDLGTGILHKFVARNDLERRQVLRSIGPVWDGNEVFLLAGGGILYFAFPRLYATSFSGFYLPLMMVLWLLILRGTSIEFRSHLTVGVWRSFWDFLFAFSSALLAIFFGAALGNVIRGVPVNPDGYFFNPLWTDFRVGPITGILDWYTVTVGVTALAALTLHGAQWLVYKTTGPVQARSLAIAKGAWWAVVVTTLVSTVATFAVQPLVGEGMAARPWGYVFPAAALASLAGVFVFNRQGAELKAFLASSGYLVGMMTSAAVSLFPYVLPSTLGPESSLTIFNAKAADYGLKIGLVWWIPGMILATGYFVYLYRKTAGKVDMDGEGY